ncbi:MAG: hypothetical protein A2X94_00460 [Bdellovibrionales bacterium GWB1_55_8]|nr:MAG: hypothetical protein A2X94_00460 [Bdellovibrionales bacterium GWB1_55_8]
MSSQKILVVEDEKDVALLISMRLKREGYAVTVSGDGQDALELANRESFDLIILDWMLPGITGLDVLKRLDRKTPVLMVTARSEPADIVLGLEMGADDYLTKPFEVSVLIARVRALMRRRQNKENKAAENRIRNGQLIIDTERHEVFCGDQQVDLTPSEFRLLTALMQNAGRVLSRNRLMEHVQGDVNVTDRTIDTHVFGLRKKLGICQDTIETIRGVGYRVRG